MATISDTSPHGRLLNVFATSPPTAADGDRTGAPPREAARAECDRVARRFDDGAGVGPLSLTVEPGRFVAIVGPSGCGKSTLLRLLAGLESPTAGTITRSADRIGYVFQEPRLLPWATAAENVALPLALRRAVAAGRDAAVGRALDEARLPASARTKRPHELSGGMRMRVAVARALVDDPDLLLLDEPFGALDALSRAELNDVIRDVWRARPRTVVFVTHDVAEAAYVSERVVVLGGSLGRIVAEHEVPFGATRSESLKTEPAFGRFVAEVTESLRGDTATDRDRGAGR